MSTQFYAYLWLREDRTPYYAGKGCGRRAYQRHRKGLSLSPPKDQTHILILDRSSEQDAFATEVELIRNWGRKDIGTGCLRNMTDGGEGASGKPKSDTFRRLISERSKGNTWGLGNRSWSGKTHTLEQKEKLRMAGLGKTHTAEARAKMSAALTGQAKTAEHKAKLRLALTGKIASAKTKAKMSASHHARHDAEFLKTVAWG